MTLPNYYWETSIFLAVLTESKAYGEPTLDCAKEIMRRCQKREVIIISSDIITVEILPIPPKIQQEQCKQLGIPMPPVTMQEAYEKFEEMRQSWTHLYIRGVDHPVARLAADFRVKCLCMKPKVGLKTPDAIHLATAAIYSRTEKDLIVHSYDHHFVSANNALGKPLTVSIPSLPDETASLFTGK